MNQPFKEWFIKWQPSVVIESYTRATLEFGVKARTLASLELELDALTHKGDKSNVVALRTLEYSYLELLALLRWLLPGRNSG